MFNFKKKFGQNFLKNYNIINKICNSIPSNYKDIYEIGPGGGALTEVLLKKFNVTAIEIDKECVDNLVALNEENLHIINQDVLNYKFDYKFVVGNLPYNIASKILTNFVKNTIPCGVFMVQKEMAQSLMDDDFTRLGCFVGICYDVEKITNVSRNCFVPAPKVESTVIRLTEHKKYSNIDLKKYDEFLLMILSQRRKSLSFLKKNINFIKALEANDVDVKKRVGQLSIEKIINIYISYSKYCE